MSNRGMIINCGGCGMGRFLKLSGTAEDIESELNKTISKGWRWVPSWDNWICPDCHKNGTELRALFGKRGCLGKTRSYAMLLGQAMGQIQSFNDLDVLTAQMEERRAKRND